MPLCFDCRNIAPLGPKPKTEYLQLQVGQWGMLARGLVECAHREPGQTYARFRSVEAAGSCPFFEPESDAEKREGRRKLAKAQRTRFTVWMRSITSK